uniref:H0313F03.10 protein n=1 Tax=Oryza sativa TaxID=4530 RepID=Q25AR0_ORYSA|nr:H0313F03.10 [Oryza sativa]
MGEPIVAVAIAMNEAGDDGASIEKKVIYLHLIVLSKLRFTLTDVQTPDPWAYAEKLGHVSMLMNWCSVCKCQQEQPVLAAFAFIFNPSHFSLAATENVAIIGLAGFPPT